MNIYVGNIPYAATETDLEELFEEYGRVAKTTIIRDRDDGRSKGFGFVEMENQEDGEQAIEALEGKKMMGRPLKVNPARPREQRRERQQFTTSGRTDRNSSDPSNGKTFHNPYTFIPTPPRPAHGFAGDFNPLDKGLDHESLKEGLWTGHIPIKLTTVTPLVLLKDEDGSKGKSTKHQKYDVLDYIPESSLRGMLRSAYEVVTNSRYGCFGNDDKLAYRMDARKAVELIPAIIEDGGEGNLTARLYTGTSTPTAKGPEDGGGKRGPMYAAMLTLYHAYPTTCHGGIPKTGEEVKAEIVRRRHRRGYSFWKAIQVCPSNKSLTPSGANNARFITGRVLITNENMRGKHDERIFFNPTADPLPLTKSVQEAWRMRIKSYREAHSDSEIWRSGAARDKPWKNIGSTPGKTAWSPHQYQDSKHKEIWLTDPHGRKSTHDAIQLKPGDMVYAHCKFDKGKIVVKDLFPVMISRELYKASPKELLCQSLWPAKQISELSPADRLFGWVLQENRDEEKTSENADANSSNDPEMQDQDRRIPKSYKSRIRIVCDDGSRPEIIQRFEGGGSLPLTILGQPKPAQGRFYVAKDGTPQNKVDKTNAGYELNKNKSLRGRKQYWHHSGLEAEGSTDKQDQCYWQPSVEDRTFQKRKGRYQEYRRPNKFNRENQRYEPQTDPQNRSINGWIKPGEVFKASLYVQNLQPQEVGALLWLLTRPDKHYFRLGYGKPLGFGSVRIELDCPNGVLPLGKGEDWKEYYTALNQSSPATLNADEQKDCVQKFRDSMMTGYALKEDMHAEKGKEEKFKSLDFIAGFLRVLKGPGDNAPIHYPRLEYPNRGDYKPNPEGKNFEWFVANDDNRGGKKLALPAVTEEKGLPYYPPQR